MRGLIRDRRERTPHAIIHDKRCAGKKKVFIVVTSERNCYRRRIKYKSVIISIQKTFEVNNTFQKYLVVLFLFLRFMGKSKQQTATNCDILVEQK